MRCLWQLSQSTVSSQEGENLWSNKERSTKQKKQAEEQAQAEAQRQQAEQLAHQTHQASYKEKKRERISLRGRIQDKQEVVREYDRTHQNVARDNRRKRDENNLS